MVILNQDDFQISFDPFKITPKVLSYHVMIRSCDRHTPFLYPDNNII